MFDHVLTIIQDAHPITYFALLMLAGLGVPVSEDLVTVWAGGALGRGVPYPEAYYVLALYMGVIGSDMLTFFIGRLAHDTMGGKVRRVLLRQQKHIDRAVHTIQKHGDRVGFIQRFSLGARLPITLVAGYSGMSPWRFLLGTAVGASLTLTIQLTIGYLAREQMIHFLQEYSGWVGLVILTTLVTVIVLKTRNTVPEAQDASALNKIPNMKEDE